MGMHRMERRKYRSSHPATALRFQLEAVRQRAHLQAVALADRSGLLLAYAGPQDACEELAAVAPMLAEARALACNGEDLDAVDVSVTPLECLGETLFLVSRGGGMVKDAFLARSIEGVCRILQQQAA